MQLPPGATLVDAGGPKLPPGATLVSGSLPQASGPSDEWLKAHYTNYGDTSIDQARERYNKRGMLDKIGDFMQDHNVVDGMTQHAINAIDAGKSGQYAKAANEGVKSVAPIALAHLPGQVAARPLATILGLGAGAVGGKVTQGVAEHLGASPDQAELAGNIGGIASGAAGMNAPKVLPLVGKVAGKVTDVVDPDLLGLLSPRAASAVRWLSKAGKVADKLSPAPAEGTAAGPVPSGEPAPAPYRLSGNQIQDATTVTPRRILGPDRQLPAAPPEATAAAPAAPPKTGQVLKDAGVTQAMKEAGIAAPSASARAVRPGVTAQLAPRADIQFPPGLSGEDASLMQLTRYNINELRFMANKRGLPVSPKDTHTALIEKIQGSLTPDETAGFTAAAQATKITPSKFPENNLMAQNLNDAATALQQAKGSPYEIASLRNAASRIQQHPESIAAVDLTKTKIPGVDKRIGKRIADFLEQQKAVPGTDDQAAGAAAAGNGGGLSMIDALRQSLIQRGIKPPY